MPQPPLAWFEFFAGGGMARLGLGHRWRCAFANEWSPKKAAAYRAYFGPSEELAVCDVATLTSRDLPGRADLVWASFPCQDLSLAGLGAGLQGARSGTFLPFWRLMESLVAEGRPPRAIVLENVTGAITSHGGRDFASILRRLAKAGYRAGAMVMDAVRWLPQSRPRLFVVAVRQEITIPDRLLRSTSSDLWHPLSLRRIDAPQLWWELPEPPPRRCTLAAILEDPARGVEWHSAEHTRYLISLMSDANLAKLREARRLGAHAAGTLYRRTRTDGTGGRRQRAEVRFDGVSGCLRTPAGGSSRQTVLMVNGNRVRSRLLSPRESARLMGVPEDYPVPANYNQACHLFGDGVAVPVVAWLSERLLLPLLSGD